MLLNVLSSKPFNQYGGAYSLRILQSHLISLPSLHGRDRSSFPGLVPPNYMVNLESVVSVKPGDSGMVIENLVDGFTQTYSAEYFVA